MADIGHGTKVTFPGAFTAKLVSISGFSLARDAQETTNMDSADEWREFMAGLKNAGELSMVIQHDPDKTPPIADASGTFTIDWPIPSGKTVAAKWSGTGLVTGYEPTAALADVMEATVTVKLSGKPTFTASS